MEMVMWMGASMPPETLMETPTDEQSVALVVSGCRRSDIGRLLEVPVGIRLAGQS